MKKVFMVIALMAMLMLPLTSFSMTAMEEGDLSSVTGQAGVSINLDVRVDLVADTLAWGDADGFTANNVTVTNGANSNAGWIGLSNLAVDGLRIRADQIMLAGDFVKKKGEVLVGDYMAHGGTANLALAIGWGMANGIANAPASFLAFWAANGTYGADALTLNAEIAANEFTPFAPLTIDVATGTGATLGLDRGDHGANVTYVRIGTGSLEVKMQQMLANVELGPDSYFPNAVAAGTPNLKYQLGSLYLGGLGLRIGGNSYVDIFTDRTGTNAQGVSIYANLTVKDFAIQTLAWGDSDGIDWAFSNVSGDTPNTVKLHTADSNLQTTDTADPVTDGAGWVGLKNLNIHRIDVKGKVDIDVATGANNFTFVNIGLGNAIGNGMNISLSGLDATAALGNTPGSWNGAGTVFTSGLNQELGGIYMSGANVTVWGGLQLGARTDGQGITIDLQNINVDIADNLVVSWGDLDGLPGVANAAGYVGLVGLNIDGLALRGKVTIDVATIDEVNPLYAATIEDMMYLGYRENNLSPTIVHIGLGSGNANQDTWDPTTALGFINDALGISITSLSGSVAFDGGKTLATPNLMGMIYASTIRVGVNGWVDIGAH